MPKCLEAALRVVTEWNQCHGAFYAVHEADLRWNLLEQDWLEYRVEDFEGVPVLLALPTNAGIAAGISGKTLWLSLHGEVPAGKEPEFINAFLRSAKHAGKTRVQVGGEEFHFVAGVPIDEPNGARLAAAFAAQGFTFAEAADFGGVLSGDKISSYIAQAREAAEKIGCTLVMAHGEEDFHLLAEFLLKEFPGRWEREFRCWKSRADTRRAFWNLLRDDNGRLLGFSRLALRGNIPLLESGWTPGAIRLPLDDVSPGRHYADSCLGPIGISATERGRGTGKILLGLSLQLLLLNKADRVCIDWTNAYNYYTPLGVRFLRKFHSTWKDV